MLAIFILLLLAMSAVAFNGITADSIWYDEYFSLYYAGAMADGSSTPMDVADRIIARESGQAPLYFVLLSVWSQVAGWNVFAARMLSLLIGSLAVAWTYRLGADMHSTNAGFCAATIMVASALFNYYLHEIRMYTLVALLVTIAAVAVPANIAPGSAYSGSSAAFALVAAGALYTHAFMTVMMAALGLFHLIVAPRTKSWGRLLILFAIAGVLFFPWALVIIAKIGSKTAPSDIEFLRSNGELLIDLARGASNGYWVFLLLPLLSIKLVRADRGLLMLWWLGIAFVAGLLAVNHNARAINQLRYFLHILPIFALLGGIACAQLMQYRKAIVLILAAFCVSGLVAVPNFGDILHIPGEVTVFHLGYPFKQISEVVKRAGGEKDAIALEFPHHSWALRGLIDYYMRGLGSPLFAVRLAGQRSEIRRKSAVYSVISLAMREESILWSIEPWRRVISRRNTSAYCPNALYIAARSGTTSGRPSTAMRSLMPCARRPRIRSYSLTKAQCCWISSTTETKKVCSFIQSGPRPCPPIPTASACDSGTLPEILCIKRMMLCPLEISATVSTSFRLRRCRLANPFVSRASFISGKAVIGCAQ